MRLSISKSCKWPKPTKWTKRKRWGLAMNRLRKTCRHSKLRVYNKVGLATAVSRFTRSQIRHMQAELQLIQTWIGLIMARLAHRKTVTLRRVQSCSARKRRVRLVSIGNCLRITSRLMQRRLDCGHRGAAGPENISIKIFNPTRKQTLTMISLR